MSGLPFEIEAFGEAAWLAHLDGEDTLAVALAANAAAARLRGENGVTDCVAGIDSIVLRYDPARLDPDDARSTLKAAIGATPAGLTPAKEKIEIPVCYGGECGPDLAALARALSLSEGDVVRRHSSQKYRVLTIGFAPGFAYLGPLPEALRTPRLATPRPRVPAGSVGVAGAMTGVYPLASPGGWPLIGRTPKRLFDSGSDNPFLFAPGAEIIFTPIDKATFARLEAEAP